MDYLHGRYTQWTLERQKQLKYQVILNDLLYVSSDFTRMLHVWHNLDLVDKAVTFQIDAWEHWKRCGDHVNCVMVPRSYFATAQPATAVECVLAPVSFTQPDVEAMGHRGAIPGVKMKSSLSWTWYRVPSSCHKFIFIWLCLFFMFIPICEEFSFDSYVFNYNLLKKKSDRELMATSMNPTALAAEAHWKNVKRMS